MAFDATTAPGHAPSHSSTLDGMMDEEPLLRSLLNDYAEAIGLGALPADSSGVVAIEMNERLVLHFAAGPQAGSAVIYARLASSLPAQDRSALLRRMLEANFSGLTPTGGTLAIDERNGAPMLVAHLRLADLSAVAFQDLVGDLAEAGQSWMDVLEGDGVPEPAADLPPALGHFIRG